MRIFIFIFGLLLASEAMAQSVVDDLDDQSFSSHNNPSNTTEMMGEKIEKIGASGRIFILSNSTGGYGRVTLSLLS